MRRLFIIACALVFVAVFFASTATPLNSDTDAGAISVKPDLYLNPAEEHVNTGLDDVKSVIASEMPSAKMETLSGGLINDSVYGKLWQFTFRTEADDHILMGIDAETREISFFFGRTGVSVPGQEQISLEEAQQIASDYIKDRDGDLDITPEMARYIKPHAEGLPGQYLVHYSRVIGGVNCLSDGIMVAVHPVNGCIMSYHKRWTMPEDQVLAIQPANLTESEASAIFTDFMTENGASGIKILSSEKQWVYQNDSADAQGFRDICLAWHIRFADDYIRSYNMTCPAVVWVDAETGDIFKHSYNIG